MKVMLEAPGKIRSLPDKLPDVTRKMLALGQAIKPGTCRDSLSDGAGDDAGMLVDADDVEKGSD
jgi:hypothetical protein